MFKTSCRLVLIFYLRRKVSAENFYYAEAVDALNEARVSFSTVASGQGHLASNLEIFLQIKN